MPSHRRTFHHRRRTLPCGGPPGREDGVPSFRLLLILASLRRERTVRTGGAMAKCETVGYTPTDRYDDNLHAEHR